MSYNVVEGVNQVLSDVSDRASLRDPLFREQLTTADGKLDSSLFVLQPNFGLEISSLEGRFLDGKIDCRFSRYSDPSALDPDNPDLDKVFPLTGNSYNLLMATGPLVGGE